MRRLLALILKELRTLLRDRNGRMVMIMPVLMQVIIFPLAATLELSGASIGVFNEDEGEASIEITQRLAAARSFSKILLLKDGESARKALDEQEILLLLRFPADFSGRIDSGQEISIQVILDGRRSNAAQIAMNYIRNILNQYQLEMSGGRPATELVIRNWYNPNLDYRWFILPSLIAIVTTIGVLIVTALSVAREREQGTLDQLLVSPLGTWQIFIGKAVPAQIIAAMQGSVVLLFGVFWYDVPFSGSLALFYAALILYTFSLIGAGMLISSFCATQQQAFIGVFMFMMPSILLSGFVSPVENMPLWLQYVSMLNPVRHFIEITKQIYLKDAEFALILQSVIPLILISTGGISLAYALFRRKIA